MSLYEKIKELCDAHGIPISYLGTVAGIPITQGAISKLKKGTIPRVATLKAIADFFKVPVTYFYDMPANSGNVIAGDRNIIGTGNTVGEVLSPMAAALVQIYDRLDVVRQARLLAFAHELEKEDPEA